jgi:hypothetical protein
MTASRDAILSPRQRLHKRVARALIEAVGGLEAAAEFCRLGKSQLSDCCNPNLATFLPIDVVADLEALVPAPIVTRALARAAGGDFVAAPAAPAASGWHEALAAVARETGHVTETLLAALADGAVCADEASDIRRLIAEARAQLAALDALAAKVEGPSAPAVAGAGRRRTSPSPSLRTNPSPSLRTSGSHAG